MNRSKVPNLLDLISGVRVGHKDYKQVVKNDTTLGDDDKKEKRKVSLTKDRGDRSCSCR